MSESDFRTRTQLILDAIESTVVGKREVVELALAILLSNGHLLIEDIPGVGKTTLAKALSRALGLEFKRIQFTPDLLPSDITGSTVYNQKNGEFEVRKGPVFTNILLADEINRTTPKTQAALLECMEERSVTIDGVSHALPSPFFVIATQNNVEMAGTYALPEAQLDRFAARITMGYPDRAAELKILAMDRRSDPIDAIQPITRTDEILSLQEAARAIHVSDAVRQYIVDITIETRRLPGVALGASPRGSLGLLRAAQSTAGIRGRDYVTPDDVKALAAPVLSHRMILRPEHRVRGLSAVSCVDEALQRVKVPLAAAV